MGSEMCIRDRPNEDGSPPDGADDLNGDGVVNELDMIQPTDALPQLPAQDAAQLQRLKDQEEATGPVAPGQPAIDPYSGQEVTPMGNKRDDDLLERAPYIWDDLQESLELDEEFYDTLFEGVQELWTKELKE